MHYLVFIVFFFFAQINNQRRLIQVDGNNLMFEVVISTLLTNAFCQLTKYFSKLNTDHTFDHNVSHALAGAFDGMLRIRSSIFWV